MDLYLSQSHYTIKENCAYFILFLFKMHCKNKFVSLLKILTMLHFCKVSKCS